MLSRVPTGPDRSVPPNHLEPDDGGAVRRVGDARIPEGAHYVGKKRVVKGLAWGSDRSCRLVHQTKLIFLSLFDAQKARPRAAPWIFFSPELVLGDRTPLSSRSTLSVS